MRRHLRAEIAPRLSDYKAHSYCCVKLNCYLSFLFTIVQRKAASHDGLSKMNIHAKLRASTAWADLYNLRSDEYKKRFSVKASTSIMNYKRVFGQDVLSHVCRTSRVRATGKQFLPL